MAVTWTEEQQKVISLRNRNILVSAAAGSGKTAVLVQRILSKILDKEHPVDIDRLLIMTFTRAAAGEMKERISAALEQALFEEPDNEHLQRQTTLIHTAQITTIDSFCSYIIKNYFHMIGLDPGYRTADEGELKLLREEILEELLEEAYEQRDEAFLELVECYSPGKTDEGLKELIQKVYESSVSHPFPEKWLQQCLEVYRVDNKEELRKARWITLLWEETGERLEEAERLADQARAVCESPEGPWQYEAALDSDLLLIGQIKQAAEQKDYDKTAELLKKPSFARLSAKKIPEQDEDKKIRAKTFREEEKDIIKELSARYFCWSEDELLELLYCCRSPVESLVKLTCGFQEKFSQKKREKNILDFTDMEHFALNILMDEEGNPSQAARELSEKYEEVMVDEYQDSNLVQEMITTMVSGWAQDRKNIFMVGDVKQSIYRFRLARPELFMEKYKTYSTEDSREQKIELHKNFRSRAQVLESVNYIFRRIMGEDLGGITYDDNNALYPGADFPEGGEFLKTEVLLVEKDSEELQDEDSGQTPQELEALAIAAEINRITGREQILDKETGTYRPLEYGDIVILLRSAYGWADTFREVLESNGIPAYTASRTGYFSAQEVVTLLNYLRVCDNPLQDIPLTGVLHSPLVGCTAQDLSLIRLESPEGLLYESLCAFIEKEPGEEGEAENCEEQEKRNLRNKLKKFHRQLQEIRDMAAYTPVHQLILYILKATGYETYVRALPGGNQRGANLRMLVEKAMDYEKTSYRGLFNFVRYIESLQKYEVDFGEVNVTDAGSGAVQIMTVHKSKGLEFPVVFAAGMGKQFNFQDINARLLIHPELGFGADAILPEKRLIAPTLHKQIIRRELKRESLGEELRVLYVALTRAKEKLYITGTIAKLEETLARISYGRNEKELLLPGGIRSGARDFWDVILPALAGHSAMRNLYLDYGIPAGSVQECRDDRAEFKIRKITASDLIQDQIVDMTDLQIREQVMKNWDCEKVYDQEIRQTLEERFEFQYPCYYLAEMPVKVSVSELKKRSWQDEEQEETVFFQKEFVPLVPRFAAEEQTVRGAAKGTAYHQVMECLDYTGDNSFEGIRKQISRLEEMGKMSPEEAECIYIKDILSFVRSDLGQRMKKASQEQKLFREQPFVISVQASEMNDSWTGGEKILVQGIIDAYFEEDGELVLVDYKTDRILPGEEKILEERYRTQLDDYAQALERLLKKKVKEKIIYSFTLQKEIPVKDLPSTS